MLTDNIVLAQFNPSCPVDRHTETVSTNPEGNSIHHLCTEKFSSILIWQEIHPCDRPQAIDSHV